MLNKLFLSSADTNKVPSEIKRIKTADLLEVQNSVILVVGTDVYKAIKDLDTMGKIHLGLRKFNWVTFKMLPYARFGSNYIIFTHILTDEKLRSFLNFQPKDEIVYPDRRIIRLDEVSDDELENIVLNIYDHLKVKKFDGNIPDNYLTDYDNMIGFDFETLGNKRGFPNIVGFLPLGFSFSSLTHGIYFDFSNYEVTKNTRPKFYAAFRRIVKDNSYRLIAYNAKFEMTCLLAMFGEIFELQDTMVFALVDEVRASLKYCGQYYCGVSSWDDALDVQSNYANLMWRDYSDDEIKSLYDSYLSNEGGFFESLPVDKKYVYEFFKLNPKDTSPHFIENLVNWRGNAWGAINQTELGKYCIIDSVMDIHIWREIRKIVHIDHTYSDICYKTYLHNHYLGFLLDNDGININKQELDRLSDHYGRLKFNSSLYIQQEIKYSEIKFYEELYKFELIDINDKLSYILNELCYRFILQPNLILIGASFGNLLTSYYNSNKDIFNKLWSMFSYKDENQHIYTAIEDGSILKVLKHPKIKTEFGKFIDQDLGILDFMKRVNEYVKNNRSRSNEPEYSSIETSMLSDEKECSRLWSLVYEVHGDAIYGLISSKKFLDILVNDKVRVKLSKTNPMDVKILSYMKTVFDYSQLGIDVLDTFEVNIGSRSVFINCIKEILLYMRQRNLYFNYIMAKAYYNKLFNVNKDRDLLTPIDPSIANLTGLVSYTSPTQTNSIAKFLQYDQEEDNILMKVYVKYVSKKCKAASDAIKKEGGSIDEQNKAYAEVKNKYFKRSGFLAFKTAIHGKYGKDIWKVPEVKDELYWPINGPLKGMRKKWTGTHLSGTSQWSYLASQFNEGKFEADKSLKHVEDSLDRCIKYFGFHNLNRSCQKEITSYYDKYYEMSKNYSQKDTGFIQWDYNEANNYRTDWNRPIKMRNDYLVNGVHSKRWSSYFHTVPSKADSKLCFQSLQGRITLYMDISQLEPRCIAYVSKDPKFMKIYDDGLDAYMEFAKLIHPEAINNKYLMSEYRGLCKQLLLSGIYGQSLAALCERGELDLKEGTYIWNSFIGKMDGVKRFREECFTYMKRHGYAKTVLGDKIYSELGREFTSCVNYVIQNYGSTFLADGFYNLLRSMFHYKLLALIKCVVHDSSSIEVDTNKLLHAKLMYDKFLLQYVKEVYNVKLKYDLDLMYNFQNHQKFKYDFESGIIKVEIQPKYRERFLDELASGYKFNVESSELIDNDVARGLGHNLTGYWRSHMQLESDDDRALTSYAMKLKLVEPLKDIDWYFKDEVLIKNADLNMNKFKDEVLNKIAKGKF